MTCLEKNDFFSSENRGPSEGKICPKHEAWSAAITGLFSRKCGEIRVHTFSSSAE